MEEFNGRNKCKGWLVLCISIMMAVTLTCPAFALEKTKDESEAVTKHGASDDTDKWQELKEKYAGKKKVKQLIFVKYKGNSEARLVLYEKVEPEDEETDEKSPTEPRFRWMASRANGVISPMKQEADIS